MRIDVAHWHGSLSVEGISAIDISPHFKRTDLFFVIDVPRGKLRAARPPASERASMGMGQEMDLDCVDEAPVAVALICAGHTRRELGALLRRLDPVRASVVVWPLHAAGGVEAEIEPAIARAGFEHRSSVDGVRLAAGGVYVLPPGHDVWFEGRSLRVTSRSSSAPCPLGRALESLARAWGRGSIALPPGGLTGDDQRGLTALQEAGGVLLPVAISKASILRPGPSTAALARDAVGSPSRPHSRVPSPPFRMQRLFPFSSLMLERLRSATEAAVRRAAHRDRLRVWIPACKTGGLVYAVAMLLRNVIAQAGSSQRLLVFGTDGDEEALAIARTGRYPAQAALGMDPELRAAYTFDEGETIRVAEGLRESCIFSSHVLTRDAPFSRIDLVVCHRVLEGLSPQRRQKVLLDLHFSLRKEGILFAVDRNGHFEGDSFQRGPEGFLQRRPHAVLAPRHDTTASRAAEYGTTAQFSPVKSPWQAERDEHGALRLELAISTAAAVAGDWSELARGLERVLRVLAGEALEIWVEDEPGLWRRRVPEAPYSDGPPPWPDGLLEMSRPLYQPRARGERSELWWSASTGDGPVAVLRVSGRWLRTPAPEVMRGLARSSRAIASCCRRFQWFSELQRREASTRKRAAQLESFFAALPLFASIHDVSGKVQHVTELARAEPAHEAARAEWLEALYSDELPPWIARVLDAREPVIDLDLRLERHGQVRGWRCNLAPLHDAQGESLGAAAILRDMDRSKRAEVTDAIEAQAPASGAAPRRRRVLIVDPEVDTAEKVAALFGRGEVEVEHTRSGEAALRALRVCRPDVVLCDLELPVMSGFSLAEQVRAEEDGRHIELIALLEDEDSALMRLRLEDAGFDRYLTKPIQLDALWRCLSGPATAALARRR